LHHLLLELIPGGAKKDLSAAQAKALLTKVRPRGTAGKTRRRVAAELIADLERIYRRKKAVDKELRELVAATGTALMDLHGIGPADAARLLVEVAFTRFPDRGHFASWNGTAPIDAFRRPCPAPALTRREPADQPDPAHDGHRAAAQPQRRPRLLRP
jgi:transposase